MSEPTENNENKPLSSENETDEEVKTTNDTSPEEQATQEVSGHKHHHHADDEVEEEFKFEKDPEFEIDYKGDCLYSVKITIPAVNIKNQTNKDIEELKEHAEVPGFRKGKAPAWLIENKFGKLVRSEAREKVISAAVKKLVEDNKFNVFSTPHFEGLDELDKLPDDEDITFIVSFEVAPKCELGKYRGIELERKIFVPDDNIILERLETLRNRFAIYQSVPDAEIAEGDQAIIDFNGTVDGESFAGGSATNYPYIVGSKRFFGKFEEALIGAKVGETKNCEVEFPEDYPNQNLAGKKALFEIKVKEIKRKELPPLDDEFAKQVGSENLEDLKQKIREELEEAIAKESDKGLELQVIDQVIANSKFEIPKSLIEEATQEQIENDIQRMLKMRIPMSEIEKQREQIENSAKTTVEKMIKWNTSVVEIAEAEGIEVADEDYENEAQNLQGKTGIDLDTIRSFVEGEGKDNVTEAIIRRKVVQLILDNAKIVDKVIPREEWEKSNE
ncbi:MAG TPA: trigger factor [Candidatus Hydrogenedens sp.]|nr:trigger factor [Candidatus Hydrogenedens sp.]